MAEAAIEQNTDDTEMTAELVSAYVSRNHVQIGDLPALISSVHAALGGLGKPAEPEGPSYEKLTPAQIKKSITPDALISFIDGKRYKALKRHLSKHGLDPASYRERYGLPHDYPTTAASYSEARSVLARSLGLGRKAEQPSREPEAATEAPNRRGRAKKAAATA